MPRGQETSTYDRRRIHTSAQRSGDQYIRQETSTYKYIQVDISTQKQETFHRNYRLPLLIIIKRLKAVKLYRLSINVILFNFFEKFRYILYMSLLFGNCIKGMLHRGLKVRKLNNFSNLMSVVKNIAELVFRCLKVML